MTQTAKAGAVGAAPARGGQNTTHHLPHGHCRPIPVYVQSRVVGHVEGAVFRKVVRGSVHMLRRPPAWALDLQSLLDAEAAGATSVEVHDTETGRTYRASVETIRRHGFTFDRGHGRQIGLALDRWTLTRSPAEVAAVQLSLLEVTP